MDIIWDELQRNNIDIDRDTLSYYIETLLEEHQDLYASVNNHINGDNLLSNLSVIHRAMNPNNFGRIIAYLTLVYSVRESLNEDSIREAVRRTINDFKCIDLSKYKRTLPQWLGSLLLTLIFAYYHV